MPIHPNKYQLGGAQSDCDSREHDYDSNDDCDGDSPADEDRRVESRRIGFQLPFTSHVETRGAWFSKQQKEAH